MAARYQHVTDALRSQVASQVGELIWNPLTQPDDRTAVTVPSRSLAAVLAAANEWAAGRRAQANLGAELLAALNDVRGRLDAQVWPRIRTEP